MKTEESLYIKILLWAYDNSVQGFSEQELFEKFEITPGSVDYKLYLKFFRDGNSSSGNPAIIDHFDTRNNISFWCLTEKGMSAAIDYLDLKEARESSKEAKRLAMWSIWIAVIVGIFQILTSFCSY
jgi:hypothetical protein